MIRSVSEYFQKMTCRVHRQEKYHYYRKVQLVCLIVSGQQVKLLQPATPSIKSPSPQSANVWWSTMSNSGLL